MKRSEQGFTLVELLVVLAVVALIGSAATMTTFQVLTATKRSNDHMTAIRQAQNAGYWISHDAQMAQVISAGDDPATADIVEFITLNWANWENGEEHTVVYTFDDMAGGLNKLNRTHWIDDGISEQSLVAEYIDADSSSFDEQEDGRWKLTIQASPGTATETREYEVDPRVNTGFIL